ncbi:hypothetical protein ACQCX2_07630 [Propionibacteriaceae bacterium Y1700]|uniref:hypothetical protein n=1 Tax=Microlunatus sp. Y1700 TaxID=3418487 RepID=UPI003DA7515B
MITKTDVDRAIFRRRVTCPKCDGIGVYPTWGGGPLTCSLCDDAHRHPDTGQTTVLAWQANAYRERRADWARDDEEGQCP